MNRKCRVCRQQVGNKRIDSYMMVYGDGYKGITPRIYCMQCHNSLKKKYKHLNNG